MLVSFKWLEELLGKKLEINNLKKISLDLGLEIEEETYNAPDDIIIGKINKLEPHPRAKNLSVIKVETTKILTIITAAKNIGQEDLVLVGPVGTKLNGQTISERDFNGVKSQGILISEQELGLTEKSIEVIVLEKGSPGNSFKEVFDDMVLDFGTTPNRPDWLSVEGIACELSVGLGVRTPCSNNLYVVKQPNQNGRFKIQIKDMQGCPRYTGRIFDDVVLKESPFWLKWRLHCMEMKPVCNIVDITNLIMLLNGQPLHPFDLDLIKDDVTIRSARNDESLITLEGTQLKLKKEDLVIADKEGPIALAGIIGGQRAQISNSTKRVLLESAYFNPKRVGHTSRRLDLITEASMRFERGADISNVDRISAMTGKMFKKYGQAREREFISLGEKSKTNSIEFSGSRLNKILSLNLTENQIKTLLKKINIQTTGEKILIAKLPSYRRDLNIEEDIYEEVARILGYTNIPEVMPKKWGGRVTTQKNRIYEETIKNFLVGQGFSETYNLSLIASKRLSDFGFNKYVRIKNPLNERFNSLRPTLFLGLLDCINYNLSKGNKSLRFFEIGNILLSEMPYQKRRLGIILGGECFPDFWQEKGDLTDYFDAKGVVENIFELLHIEKIKFKEVTKKGFRQAVEVVCSGKNLGYLGCIDENLCKEPYYYVELALDKTLSFVNETFYIPPAKFPASTRDLSFLVDKKIAVPNLFELINKVGGPVLEKVILFDFYKGKNIPSDKKNLGFRLSFRAPDRTLTDKEVDRFIGKIEDEVTARFNAKLRKKE